ncbi:MULTISPECIES: glycosyltransferase family 2 protein [unclassified Haloarcula]|uniref:glycosyltransferase family 2 protein n=1 Tax=unclassified Haloarcula TaxID=2624677 RepID=UPI0009ADC717|nr:MULTISPECIES: glycosyltransferase family 2 protein [unclassified Haloarcula]
MPDSDPMVSVIIPTYHRNDLLLQAIKSVYNQSYRPIEVIVVDDSGEEHARPTVESCEYHGLRYVPLEKNRGQNAALNRGLDEVSGRYVQFLDDDDEIIGEKFSKQVFLLESQDEVGVVYCGLRNDNGTIHLPREAGRGDVLEQALQFNLFSCVTSTMLIDIDVLSSTAPLPTPPGSTDIYMKIEFAQSTNFDFVPEPGILKRDVSGSVSSSWGAIVGHKRIFKKYRCLYNQFPEEVQRTALARFYNRKGSYLVGTHSWSPKASYAFAKAVYYHPQISLPYLGRLFGSIFGRPGVTVVEQLMAKIGCIRCSE